MNVEEVLAATGPGEIAAHPVTGSLLDGRNRALAAAELLENWPGGYAIKASPPPADYDRPTMRAYATKSRPHIVNPKRPTHTLCGKKTDWWVMVATALADWPAEKFTECGCANCARIAGRLGLA